MVVVINGPVANAGSILYLFNIKGTKVPKSPAYVNTATRDTPIVRAKLKSLLVNQQKINAMKAHIKPLNKSTRSSLKSFLKIDS